MISIPKFKDFPKDDVRNSLKFLLGYGKILGIFPTTSIEKFKWRSGNAAYATFIVFLNIYLLVANGALKRFSRVSEMYYLTSISFLLLLRLTLKWPGILKKWIFYDKLASPRYGFPKNDSWICIVSLTIYVLVNMIQPVIAHLVLYSQITDVAHLNVTVEAYLRAIAPEILEVFPYNLFSQILVLFVGWYVFMLISYADLFLIIISLNVAKRFELMNNYVQLHGRAKKQTFKENLQFWCKIREDYCRLSDIVFTIDESIGMNLIFSYAVNLFWNLQTLTFFLVGITNKSQKLCWYFTGLHVFIRMVSVTACASRVNFESQSMISILHSLDAEDDNPEVRRLLLQMSFDEVALTGANMFKLKKVLVLKIISVIVTYELIVIQYISAPQL